MEKNINFYILTLVGILFSLNLESLQVKESDIEYWQLFNFTNWKKGPYTLYTTGQVRFDYDISRVYHYQITENFAYDVLSYLTLEAHYTYINSRPRHSPKFSNVQRIELEANPFITLPSKVQIAWRNRISIEKFEHNPIIEYTFRHRVSIVFPIDNYGLLTDYIVRDEVFYHYNQRKITQNRFTPLCLTFTLNDQLSIDLFFMIRHFFSSVIPHFRNSFVLGTELQF